jgi:hypothetical protein
MAQKTAKTTNNSTTVTAPKIASAWSKVCSSTIKAEDTISVSALILVDELRASQLSIKDIQKVIKDTNKTSSVLLISHIEGLTTWADLRAKHADFRALPLDKQFSRATAAYKMLGAGNAQQLATWDAIDKATKAEKALRNSKASTPKEDKPAKEAKTPKTHADTLKSILAYFTALDLAQMTDDDLDLIAEIHATIENKVEVMA